VDIRLFLLSGIRPDILQVKSGIRPDTGNQKRPDIRRIQDCLKQTTLASPMSHVPVISKEKDDSAVFRIKMAAF
jgi:protein tyrosine phosphatase (PTP) superfamily phosphohydrolase (DUF442 family)